MREQKFRFSKRSTVNLQNIILQTERGIKKQAKLPILRLQRKRSPDDPGHRGTTPLTHPILALDFSAAAARGLSCGRSARSPVKTPSCSFQKSGTARAALLSIHGLAGRKFLNPLLLQLQVKDRITAAGSMRAAWQTLALPLRHGAGTFPPHARA